MYLKHQISQICLNQLLKVKDVISKIFKIARALIGHLLVHQREFDAEGKRTGSYTLGKDELLVNSQGNSYISYADYAIAIVDEVSKCSSH